MAPRSSVGPAADPARNRCRCGHFPTSHMRVVPISAGSAGSYRLDPDGPCAICGESSCRAFSPSI